MSDEVTLVRQMENALAVYFQDIDPAYPPKNLYQQLLAVHEPMWLRATMTYCQNNQSRAAAILGLNRATLRKKLQLHRIIRPRLPYDRCEDRT